MRTKLFFFLLIALAAIVVSPLVGGMAVAVGALAGMDSASLLILFGSATGGVFAALMALAALAASLFFSTEKALGN